jgi:hypothetical protein
MGNGQIRHKRQLVRPISCQLTPMCFSPLSPSGSTGPRPILGDVRFLAGEIPRVSAERLGFLAGQNVV